MVSFPLLAARALFSPWTMAWLLLVISPVTSAAIQVEDLAGRAVTLDQPPTRIFLAQPRQLYALAALDPHIDRRLIGWSTSLERFDASAYRAFTQVMPALADVPAMASAPSPTLNVEWLAAQAPDLVIFNSSQRPTLRDSRALELLDSFGIAYVFIDFYQAPLDDQTRSLHVLGELLGVPARADDIIDFIDERVANVDRLLADVTARPSVLINIAPGLKTLCCRTNRHGGLADLVARAKGDNIADAMPTAADTPLLSAEFVLSRDPDVIINTAAEWGYGDTSIRAGFGIDDAQLDQDLRQLIARQPGWSALAAVKRQHFHAMWHYLHHGPFAFAALEAIARWLHPEATAELNPRADLARFFERFMPIPDTGTFWDTPSG